MPDHEVLEAVLEDLASERNPEYRYHIQNVGPGREIVIDDNTCVDYLEVDLAAPIDNIDHSVSQSVSRDLREDFHRRNTGKIVSIKGFKPTNPNILVADLDKIFSRTGDAVEEFETVYPAAWGYVRAYLPAYSSDGTISLIVFDGGPHGDHGLNWIYIVKRQGSRWVVEWRVCRPRE